MRNRQPKLRLRIDCGTGSTPTDVGQRFTDTFAYKDLKLTFTFSCYLIKHGDEHMVWDTGFAPGTSPNAPKVGIVDRLKELKVAPEQVKYVGISYFHGDHTGQLAPFTNAIVNNVINAGPAVRGTLTALKQCGAQPVAIATLAVYGEASKLAQKQGIALETLATFSSRIWEPSACPLCAKGAPVDA